jgi:protein TonB
MIIQKKTFVKLSMFKTISLFLGHLIVFGLILSGFNQTFAAKANISVNFEIPVFDNPEINDSIDDNNENVQEIHYFVEEMPKFPRGELALRKYIAMNVTYPQEASNNNIQGKVILQFEITNEGKVGKVKVVRKVHPILDKEAIRVVKSLPQFIPGKQKGKAVNTWYTIPINFRYE